MSCAGLALCADILRGMEEIWDKVFVLLVCVALMAGGKGTAIASVALLLAGISASAAIELAFPRRRKLSSALAALSLAAAALLPGAAFLLPLFSYDALRCFRKKALPFAGASAAAALALGPEEALWSCAAVLACAGAILLSWRTLDYVEAAGALHETQDALQDELSALRAKNAELDEARDEEVHAAELAERTRIARSIHDSVGHILTRLILEVEAMKVMHQGEGTEEADLEELSRGLSEAMGSMRASVHALEDTGLDAEAAIRRLAENSGIGAVTLSCGLEEGVPVPLRRFLVSFAREALTNAARHAHASHATIEVRSFPGMWQISCENDGDVPDGTEGLEELGMGIAGMRSRTEELGGVFSVTSGEGRFRVFASIPKEREAS